jgi:hypothetical protein
MRLFIKHYAAESKPSLKTANEREAATAENIRQSSLIVQSALREVCEEEMLGRR